MTRFSRKNSIEEVEFIATVWQYYHASGRHDLPWRKTRDPYRILVSEIMLQQTQASRVIMKYRTFLRRFPNTKTLAQASLADVLTVWQGLGYNRRAKYLKEAARVVYVEHAGRWPRTAASLKSLPGIGPYTAGAVAAFAFNEVIPIIETNIRTAYLYHFFPQIRNVSDDAIFDVVRATLDHTRPREWYYALMDYGTHIKQTIGNVNHQSKHYVKQTAFRGSNRAVRGAVMRQLLQAPAVLPDLSQYTEGDLERLRAILNDLIKDKLIILRGAQYEIAE